MFSVSSHALALNHTPVSQLSEAQHTRPKQRQKNISSQTKPVISHHKRGEEKQNRLTHEHKRYAFTVQELLVTLQTVLQRKMHLQACCKHIWTAEKGGKNPLKARPKSRPNMLWLLWNCPYCTLQRLKHSVHVFEWENDRNWMHESKRFNTLEVLRLKYHCHIFLWEKGETQEGCDERNAEYQLRSRGEESRSWFCCDCQHTPIYPPSPKVKSRGAWLGNKREG